MAMKADIDDITMSKIHSANLIDSKILQDFYTPGKLQQVEPAASLAAKQLSLQDSAAHKVFI